MICGLPFVLLEPLFLDTAGATWYNVITRIGRPGLKCARSGTTEQTKEAHLSKD